MMVSKPVLKALLVSALKLKCDEPLSSVAFKFKLRRYTKVTVEQITKVGAMQADPRLTHDVYGYRVRCIRIQGQIRTDMGSNLYGYRVRWGGAG